MGSQIWSLLSLGVGLNLVLGALVAAFKLPIYLDSLGTVLVGALAGPGPAALAGGCGVALLGLTSPTALAFLPVGVAVGVLTGLAAKLGVFRSAWSAGLVGALVGCASASIAAPIASYMFGGVTGGGTDLMVALFRAGGLSTLQAAWGQGLAVDPADKAATFLIVYALLRALPRRATAAFPLAERLPTASNAQQPSYRPRHQKNPPGGKRLEAALQIVAKPVHWSYPQASSGWKVLSVLSLLLMAGFAPRPSDLTAALVGLLLSYGLAAPGLTWLLTRRLVLALVPLAVSLVIIHGLVASQEGEIRTLWSGLSWSLLGLHTAWHFLARVAVMLLAVSVFLATTPLQRLAELLLRWRVPYALVFVFLTGANLGARLKQRWKIVEEAQQARGLDLHPAGVRARLGVLFELLTPTLGAVFSEIPLRAANLESRGFLSARPKADIPLSWTGEPEPSKAGWLFHLWLVLASWSFLLWSYS